ncbi:hypothetical protein Lbir_2138 [Legionella birminghamensis]|uniref:Uncharacterized protein n=1 Tax=Legionella birminghamensis TaxID=28083 RepID=A0A378I9G5_9GAMM|nr:hypothetical protein [Legionella birminghamensis]KTC69399.1 hypothetical protein Lbir_2138 [Legionella birminghamensis]STX31663.1 Uncharacterised protein [Legionella birminghamensis]
MFSKREDTSTRFTDRIELNKVGNHLTTLRTRTRGMQASAMDVGSLSYDKYQILQKILKDIDTLIAEFNDRGPQSDPGKELREVRELLIEIHRVIAKISIHHIQTLLTFRNGTRNNIKQVILYGSMGAGIAAGAALSGPVGALFLMFGGGYLGSKTNHYAGLSGAESLLPESMKILEKIGSSAGEAIKAISKTLTLVDSSIPFFMNSQSTSITECHFEDRTLLDSEIKPGMMYICRADKNDFLAYAWRKEDGSVKRVNLNDFMQDDEKFKNYCGVEKLDESRQKAFLAILLQGSNRFSQSQYDEKFQTHHECYQRLSASEI